MQIRIALHHPIDPHMPQPERPQRKGRRTSDPRHHRPKLLKHHLPLNGRRRSHTPSLRRRRGRGRTPAANHAGPTGGSPTRRSSRPGRWPSNHTPSRELQSPGLLQRHPLHPPPHRHPSSISRRHNLRPHTNRHRPRHVRQQRTERLTPVTHTQEGALILAGLPPSIEGVPGVRGPAPAGDSGSSSRPHVPARERARVRSNVRHLWGFGY